MRNKIFYISLLLMVISCREKYVPQIKSPVTGYLVVEGAINSGDGVTNINLSRTIQVNADSLQHEHNAIVQVEGTDNTIYNLTDLGTGVYSADHLHLNNSIQYRLRIKTADGKEYLSDFVESKTTPPIDSLHWEYGNDGVDISLSTHDPQNNARYYNWSYEETWQFHSDYVPQLKFDTIKPQYWFQTAIPVVVFANFDSSKYTCWTGDHSTQILIASTSRLSEDVVDKYHIAQVPKNSQKISVMYSILVKQHAITQDAYEFLQKMKKNTEQTGSVFDAQPSELKGNIHCISNQSEIVVGFVSVSTEETKRIFIKNSEVPNWGYESGCYLAEFSITQLNQAIGSKLLPVEALVVDPATQQITRFNATLPTCVDCTFSGANQKPAFWP